MFNALSFACDTTAVNQSGWRVIFVDSEETAGEGADNGHAIHCFDGDAATFWHTQWQNANTSYPHEIWIDLGAEHNVNGFSLLTRNNNSRNGRVSQFEFYITNDTTDWGAPQVMGVMEYPQPNSGEQQTASVFFGAVEGRFVRLVALSSVAGDKHVMLAEFNVFEDTACAPTGKRNQVIYTTDIPRQLSTNQPFAVSAYASSSLPLTYEVVEGPAVAADSILTLTGEGGVVRLRVSQEGSDSYYPAETFLSFEVINLQDYYPVIETKFTSSYPVEMPRLMPYLLHAQVSIAESEYLSISSVKYSVEGVQTDAVCENGDYLFWWTPSDYATFPITITATASNGNTTTETVLLEVSDFIQNRTETTLDSAVIDMGTIGSQWYYGSYELPQFVGAYNAIEAYLNVTCPAVPGGCDDWDRLAWVQVKDPTGKWVELLRYITPYGKACAHHIDVTDYASLLQGKVEMRVYIETWGTGGWQFRLDFDYTAGEPEHPYTYLEEMWQGTYNFGDMQNLQPVDTVTVGIFHAARKAHLRLVTTGHGWGDNNSDNAAEFYHAVHHLQVNGEDTFEQDLWTNCNPNPDGCNLQQGTYKYPRAGWCPGVIAKPFIYDLTNLLWKTPFQLSYIFQTSYIDYCHPNNPDCVSGVTCENCNDTYNPHYRVSCYLIRESDEPRVLGEQNQPRPSGKTLTFSAYPNPSRGLFRLDFDNEINEQLVCAILDVRGATLKTFFFADSRAAEEYLFNLSSLQKGTYFLQVYSKSEMSACKIVLQ